MSFTRRFTSMPPTSVIQQIEAINIIDLVPTGDPGGVSTNVTALVGEFADMTFATACDASGNITTQVDPIEIFGSQDLLDKVGGFDATLGQFGAACGNGFVELRNKKFGRLIIAPVNLASASGIHMWRQLPTNKSATDPTPVVPVLAATVPGGYVLKDAAQALERMLVAGAVNFTGDAAYLSGADGAVTNGAAAATVLFTSAGGTFTTVARPDGQTGVQVGDVIVIGVIGLVGAQGDDAGTYRVVAVNSDTTMHVQNLDGSNLAFTTTSSVLIWRLHYATVADSFGQGLLSSQATFTVPVRPITNDAGTGVSNADGTWPTGTSVVPLVAPLALTATTADPLSGLAGKVGPTIAVAYTHLVQAPNAANGTALDALYQTALDALRHDDVPESEVTHVWCARKSANIRTALQAHVDLQSSTGTGRTCSVSPELNQPFTTAITIVTGNSDPGVGAHRDDRLIYDWPANTTYVPEAVGVSVTLADGSTTTTGILDVTTDGWMACILGNLAPYRNPGESTDLTQALLRPLLGYAHNTPKLDMNVWTLLRQRGIAGVRMDKDTGPVFQSGVTSSLTPGRINIARRKMADFIEDSEAQILKPFSKLPLTDQVMDDAVAEVGAFLEGLKSVDQPDNQQIADYSIDLSSNTQAGIDAGIFIIDTPVRTLSTADFIVVRSTIGEGVVITQQLAAGG